ncbi:MAG TPA: CHAT domain-containing protein, partial [Kofleriaceae bacterium]|nr:CHAT domain-containing protein [Kofleriaceae bacterium]
MTSPLRSRGWLVAVAAAVLALHPEEPGGRPDPAPDVCGWPCARGEPGCEQPCFQAIEAVARDHVVRASAISQCRALLDEDPDPRVGESVLLALSFYPAEAPDLTAALGQRLAELGQPGTAAGVAAKLAFDRDDYDEALARLRDAARRGAPACSVARIATWLAPKLYDAGELGGALETAQLGLDAMEPYAGAGDDVRSTLQLAQSIVIQGIGNVGDALRATDELLAKHPPPVRQGWIHAARITLLYDAQGPRQAEEEVWIAVRWALVSAFHDGEYRIATQVLNSAYHNLAGLELEQRRYEASQRALELAFSLSIEDATAERLFSYAGIDRARGDLPRAEQELEDALVGGGPTTEDADHRPPVGDMVTAIPIDLARVRLQRGDERGAEDALRRAIGRVEELRASIPASDGLMIAKYRQAYEELLGILVGEARWADALEVLARLDAGRLVSDIGAPRERALARDAQEPPRTPMWEPPPSEQPRVAARAGELLAAWRGRHLVAVFRAGERLCRLEAVDGALGGACMGEAAPIERAAEALREDPNDAASGRIVGDAIIPPGTDAVDLLLVGPIARAPAAALRDAHGLVVAHRPVERVLGLLDDERVPPADGPARVIGYAGRQHTAVAAEHEADEVARQLGVPAVIGAAATADALAGGGGLLHFAGHAHLVDGEPALELADGDLPAEAIAARTGAPRLVVLASCDSAAAKDDGGWGSLAAAFLHAGSERVIASDRAVDDDEAQALMRAFYDAGGVRDPARALGVSQAARWAALAADARPPASTTWAAFTVIAAPPRGPAP